MNPILVKAITSNKNYERYLAQRILSALRGPDDEDSQKKRDLTAPIRRWVYPDKEEYTQHGFVPVWDEVEKTWKDVEARTVDKYKGYSHFMGHIDMAVQAISELERIWPPKGARFKLVKLRGRKKTEKKS